MDQESIARYRAQHERALQRWWHEMPGTEEQYKHCTALMGHEAGSLHWDGYRHVDASWDSHRARHVFGLRDSLQWLALIAEMQARNLAGICSLTGSGPENEQSPLDDWAELYVPMTGVLWLAERFAPQPDQAKDWYCDDCVCGEYGCERQTEKPLSVWCWEHTWHGRA